MNLNEIQSILKKKLNTSNELTSSIVEILNIVRSNPRPKKDIMDIIERDSKKWNYTPLD